MLPKLRLLAMLGMLMLGSGGAAAADFPTKPIRLVHGFAPGGPADVISRVIAQPLSARLGQPVLVESRPGASGIIASEAVARAEPDGHTLGLFIGGHTVTAALNAANNKALPYDSVESFQPISSLVFYAFVIAARSNYEAKTLPELIALAKSKPGSINYGSAGTGTTSHLIGELLKSMAGINMVHVPYKGDSASVTALLAGDIQLSIANTPALAPRVQSGALRALAISSPARWSGLPEVPTVAEGGLGSFDARTWAGIMGPKGMPRPVVDRLQAAIQQSLAIPEVKNRLEAIVGGDARASTPEEMRAMLVSQIASWTKVVREANIKVD